MSKGKDIRIMETKRKIDRRVKILRGFRIGISNEPLDKREEQSHRCHKWNITCSCFLCKPHKYAGNGKNRKSIKEKKLPQNYIDNE